MLHVLRRRVSRCLTLKALSPDQITIDESDRHQPSKILSHQYRRGITVSTIVGVATIILVIAIMIWSAHESDRISRERDADIAATVLSQSIERVAHAQESSTIWDDAVLKTAAQPLDLDWIDLNLGTWFWDYAAIDEVYILDPSNLPIYAMQQGRRTNPANYMALRAQSVSAIENVRNTSGKPHSKNDMPVMLSHGASDIVTINGRPAILSVKPIVSDSGEISQIPGSEALHVGVVYLDRGYFGQLSDQYGLHGARYKRTPNLAAKEAHVPLLGVNQELIGYLVWRPFAPGADVISTIAPALGLGAILAVCFIVALSLRLGRRTMDLYASRAQAEHIAFHDQLTGLPNRAQFEAVLDATLSQSFGRSGSFALLFVDLDRFKIINDTLGHPAGDLLLKEVASRLTSAIRASDIVARLGGDEFALILKSPIGSAIIDGICSRIVSVLAEPFDLLGVQSYIGASIGVVIAPQYGADRSELARKADIALYRAKSEGRSRHVIFNPQMDQAAQFRENFTRDLGGAIVDCENQLQIVYLPIFCAATCAMTGVEALIRWNHPERGNVSPDTFIKFAEESGLIEDLGDWIFRKVFSDAKLWPDLRIAINVSPVQARQKHFSERIMRWLKDADINPKQLELEITETALMDSNSEIGANLKALRANNVRIALDDFGVGFSSLSYIRDIAVDRIKIDRSFVVSSGTSKGDALLEAIIKLARSNNIDVTAEGVESQEQFEFLRRLGCHEAQGYYLSSPLSVAELLRAQSGWATGSHELLKRPAA